MDVSAADARFLSGYYQSGHDDLEEAFFRPCLRLCTAYERAVGYFSSSALVAWAEILPRLVDGRTTKIRLLASPELQPGDLVALEKAIDPHERSQLLDRFCAEFVLGIFRDPHQLLDARLRVQLLGWLIVQGCLELRFAFPAHVTDPGLYHEKIGVFEFPNGDMVAFTGSANETRAGFHKNWESIDVFRSWVPADLERVRTKQRQFRQQWDGLAPGLEVRHLSMAVLAEIRERTGDTKPVIPRWMVADSEKPILHGFQARALDGWLRSSRVGLLEMCTGSGKTVVAIEAIRRTFSETAADLAVVACPTRVLADQWIREIDRWTPAANPVPAYEATSNYSTLLQLLLGSPTRLNPGRIVVTTYQTFFSVPFQAQLRGAGGRGKQILLVADEAHHISTKGLQEQLCSLGGLFVYRLALTATPEIESSPEATEKLLEIFRGPVFRYSLEEAIADRVLCPYNYFPRPAFLDHDLGSAYADLLVRCESASGGSLVELYRQRRELLRKSGIHIAELARLLDELGSNSVPLELSVIFTPPGREDDEQKILEKVKQELDRRFIVTGSIVAGTPQDERRRILDDFRGRSFKVLLGIGCLDEGLDVPETRTAIILYSVDRLKQFIQRRGRVLRKAPGKDTSAIYDLILLPQGADLPPGQAERILERELRRYREFAAGALNREQAGRDLDAALGFAGAGR